MGCGTSLVIDPQPPPPSPPPTATIRLRKPVDVPACCSLDPDAVVDYQLGKSHSSSFQLSHPAKSPLHRIGENKIYTPPPSSPRRLGRPLPSESASLASEPDAANPIVPSPVLLSAPDPPRSPPQLRLDPTLSVKRLLTRRESESEALPPLEHKIGEDGEEAEEQQEIATSPNETETDASASPISPTSPVHFARLPLPPPGKRFNSSIALGLAERLIRPPTPRLDPLGHYHHHRLRVPPAGTVLNSR